MVWGFLSSCSNYSTCAINHVHDLKNLIQGLIKNWKNSKEHSFHIFYIKIWPSFKTWPPTHKYLYTDGVDVKLHLNIIPGHGLDSFLFKWIKFFHPDDSVPMNNIIIFFIHSYVSPIPVLQCCLWKLSQWWQRMLQFHSDQWPSKWLLQRTLAVAESVGARWSFWRSSKRTVCTSPPPSLCW